MRLLSDDRCKVLEINTRARHEYCLVVPDDTARHKQIAVVPVLKDYVGMRSEGAAVQRTH